MRTTTISRGGQISIPAELRHRWGTRRVVLEERGGALMVRPVPDDPIGAAIGSLRGRRPASDEARAILRQEDAAADERKQRGRRR